MSLNLEQMAANALTPTVRPLEDIKKEAWQKLKIWRKQHEIVKAITRQRMKEQAARMTKEEKERIKQIKKKYYYDDNGNNTNNNNNNSTKDNFVLAGFIALLISAIPAIALGAYFINWVPIIYGLGVIGILMAVAFSSGGHGDNSGLYEAAHYRRSRRGRAFRTWFANRRT